MEKLRGAERIGTIIRDKYHLDRVLGTGGMAVVYAATHRNKKRFAVKMLHAELSSNRQIRERFLREGYVANSVEHSGAVAVLDEDVAEDGSAFLVMELLDGQTIEGLSERLGGKLAVDAVLAIADRLLDVLVAAHAKSIVHRDLKPANVFLTRDCTVKILDFGIARLHEPTAGGVASTQTGAMIGTPAFMPPEQAAGRTREIDARTDLWAVGATMFTMISGQIVHDGENGTQIVIAAATQPARSLREAFPEAPDALVHVVDKALAFEPSARWESAQAMQQAVRSAYAAIEGHPMSSEPLVRLALNLPPPSTTASPMANTVLVSSTDLEHGGASLPRRSGAGETTAQPLTFPLRTRSRSRLPFILGAGAITAIATAVGWQWFVRSAATGSSQAPQSASLTSYDEAPPSISPSPSSSTSPPVASSISPPVSTLTLPHARMPNASPRASSHPAATRPSCDPPWVIDATTGHKTYKQECLSQ